MQTRYQIRKYKRGTEGVKEEEEFKPERMRGEGRKTRESAVGKERE